MSKISRRRDSYPQGALTVPPVREPHPLTNALICPPWLGPNHRRILSHEYGRLQSYAFPGQPIPYVFPQPDTYRQYPPMPRPPFDPGNPPSYAPPPPPSPQIQIHPDLLPAYLQSLSYDEARKTADRALREALRAERVRQANRQETPDPPRLGSMYGDQLISPLGSQHEQSDTSKTMVTKTHGNPPESCNDADSFSALPAELKVAIFGKLTALNDLDALASVNHGWHATFLGAQQAILQDFAAALISADVDLSEPIRAQHSEAMILALYTTPCPVRLLGETGELQKRLYNQIEAINEDWKANSFQTILQQFHLQDLRKLIRTHQEIQYLVQDFASIALSNFPVEGMEDHPMTLRALSQSERQSIFTAFYRWRRWCILFGWQPYLLQEIENTGRKLGQAYTFANPQADKFAADLTAWDLEALACVEEYASTRWSQFGKAIQADIIDRLPGGYVSEHLNDRDSYKLRVFDEYCKSYTMRSFGTLILTTSHSLRWQQPRGPRPTLLIRIPPTRRR